MRTRLLTQSALSVAMAMAAPSVVHAYSLGDIRVTSQLGETFYAEIPLHLRQGESVKDFTVTLANTEEYLVLELHRSPVNVQLDLRIQSDTRGPRIVLKSESPIQEPFFNLLLKTASGGGSHFRNFPVFLDIKQVNAAEPPGRRQAREPAVVQDVVREDKTVARTARKPAPAVQPAPAVTAPGGSEGAIGPVRRGESLIHIAKQLRDRYPGISDIQIAQLLWRNNPHAFGRGNINLLLEGATLALPAADTAAKTPVREAARPEPAKPKPEAKAEPKPAGPAPKPPAGEPPPKPVADVRRSEGRAGSATGQTVTEPAKPKTAGEMAFDQKVTMHVGDQAKGGEGDQPTPAPAVPPEGAVQASEARDALNLQLAKSLSRLETMESRLDETSSALQNSEKARVKLQSTLSNLQERLDQLEKEKADSEWSLGDMLLYAGGGVGVLVLAGLLAFFSRRGKPPMVITPLDVPPPRRPSPFGAAMVGAAAGAAAVAASQTEEKEEDEEETVLAAENGDTMSLSAADFQNEETEEFAPAAAQEADGPNLDEEEMDLGHPDLDLGDETEHGALNLDLAEGTQDLDLDAFATSTVMMGSDQESPLGGGQQVESFALTEGLADMDEALDETAQLATLLHASPSRQPAKTGGMEELDIGALDDMDSDSPTEMVFPSLDEEAEEDVGGLFLPGKSFEEDEQEKNGETGFGTLQATPLQPGPGLAAPSSTELESIDLASLGLDEDEPTTPGPAAVDLDLDLDGLSLGNLDDELNDMAEDQNVKPIEIPAFDVVELDFGEGQAEAKKAAPKPPQPGMYELTTLDLELEDEGKK